MLLFNLVSFLSLWIVASKASDSIEIAIHQLGDQKGCRLVSVRSTPIHRLVTPNKRIVVEKDPLVTNTPSSGTRLRIYAINSDREHLLDVIERHCVGLDFQEEVLHALSSQGSQWENIMFHNLEYIGAPPSMEIKPLFISGPSQNRVDLVFFSDGYQDNEKDKFFHDAYQLAYDMSHNQTFATVNPLLNFWAAFTASPESGIGVGGAPRNTTYGLYRDGTELRGVYCSKEQTARAAALSLGPQCDYPILLANDPLYGGLGGEFTISTVSEFNGPLVLRHELGHSIIQVGEEYDGGFAYFGPNSQDSKKLRQEHRVKWQHWLEDQPASNNEASYTLPRIERSAMPHQSYPWMILNETTSPFLVSFNSSGTYSRFLVKFSLSGIPHRSDLKVELDGVDLKFTPHPGIGMDRWHYEIESRTLTDRFPSPLKEGPHEIKFTLGETADQTLAQLCSVEVLEFGSELEFNDKPGAIGLYPTFSFDNHTTYRPTNDACLMRRVIEPNLCPVCVEGLWLRLLRRVDLIDSLSSECSNQQQSNPEAGNALSAGADDRLGSSKNPQIPLVGNTHLPNCVVIHLNLVPLAHLRQHPSSFLTHTHEHEQTLTDEAALNQIAAQDAAASAGQVGHGESYVVEWRKDGDVMDKYTNSTSIQICTNNPGLSDFEVMVKFLTDEVRMDEGNLLIARRRFTVLHGGCSEGRKPFINVLRDDR